MRGQNWSLFPSKSRVHTLWSTISFMYFLVSSWMGKVSQPKWPLKVRMEWCKPRSRRTWRFLLVLEIWVHGVRLRKQKHLRKDLEPVFHVSFISSLIGMPGREWARGRNFYCRQPRWVTLGRVPGVFIHGVLTVCQALVACDRTRQTGLCSHDLSCLGGTQTVNK